jgi:chromosome segregation ATPase
VIIMTRPQRDPRIDRLRRDVDDIYGLINTTDQTVHTALASIRGVDLRLRRFQKTSGKQFGVLIATLRQHGKRLDRIDERLGGADERFDGIAQRFDSIDGRLDGHDEEFRGINQKLDEMLGLLRPR